MTAKAIPDGYHTVTPYVVLKNAADALRFYKSAFGAAEVLRLEHQGKVVHAEIQIGDSRIMLAEEVPEMGYLGPQSIGGTPVSILLYVEDVDARFAQAAAAGAAVLRPVVDQFYGDRSGTLKDPFGHVWTIATRKEDLTLEEIRRRMEHGGRQ